MGEGKVVIMGIIVPCRVKRLVAAALRLVGAEVIAMKSKITDTIDLCRAKKPVGVVLRIAGGEIIRVKKITMHMIVEDLNPEGDTKKRMKNTIVQSRARKPGDVERRTKIMSALVGGKIMIVIITKKMKNMSVECLVRKLDEEVPSPVGEEIAIRAVASEATKAGKEAALCLEKRPGDVGLWHAGTGDVVRDVVLPPVRAVPHHGINCGFWDTILNSL